MNETPKNRFDDIAYFLHEGGKQTSSMDSESDFKSATKIYALREKVKLLKSLKKVEKALEEVNHRLEWPNRKQKISMLLKYAAIFIGCIGIAGIIYKSFFTTNELGLKEISSSTGEMKQIKLPDSTFVWLGANSELKYGRSFGQTNRNVQLNGEAMFYVTKNKKLAFRVQIGTATIVVHGTKFLANGYAESNKSEVTLLEGKIEYKNGKQPYIMIPGEKLIDNHSLNKVNIEKIDVKKYRNWICGKFYFEHEKLSELTFFLEQWYGVHFVFQDDSLKNYAFTGVINKEKKLIYTLDIISLTNKVKFKKNENKITITN